MGYTVDEFGYNARTSFRKSMIDVTGLSDDENGGDIKKTDIITIDYLQIKSALPVEKDGDGVAITLGVAATTQAMATEAAGKIAAYAEEGGIWVIASTQNEANEAAEEIAAGSKIAANDADGDDGKLASFSIQVMAKPYTPESPVPCTPQAGDPN